METIKIWPGWEIKEQIGEGDLGKVFRIERTDAGITREAALKVIEISGDSNEIKMFRKMGMDEDSILEIYEERKNQLFTSIVRLSCLRTAYGIASVEDFDSFWNEEASSWTILVRSEFLESLDAYGKNKGGDLLPEEIAEMGRDIAGSLMTLEKEGITTLSVKPSNILRNSEGSYKLSDAGINEGIGRLAASKVGTLFSWDAPELVRSGIYDQTSDIYSLGMVMYVLLNGGKRPFMEEGGVLKRWMQFRIANEKRVSGEPLPKPVNGDEELQNIVLKACAPNPPDRYQNALELREALEIWLFGQRYGMSVAGADAVPTDHPADEAGKEAPQAEDAAVLFPAAVPEFAVTEENLSEQAEPEAEIPAESMEADVEISSGPADAEAEIPSGPADAEAEILSGPADAEAEIPSGPADAEAEIPSEPAEAEICSGPEEKSSVETFSDLKEEPSTETVSAAFDEPEPEEGSEQFADMTEDALASAEDKDDVREICGDISEEVLPDLPVSALETIPVISKGTDLFASNQTVKEPDDEDVLHVRVEDEDLLSDAVHTDQPEKISLFKKSVEEPENDTEINGEIPSVSLRDEGVQEKELNPFAKDFPGSSEQFGIQEETDREPAGDSEDLLRTPDIFDSTEEKDEEPDILPEMPLFAGFGDDDEVTTPISDENRQIPENQMTVSQMPESQRDSEKSLDDSGADFFRTGADIDIDEPKKEEIPPKADVFMYIFQREDRLFGIHSMVSENGGGVRLKMKSEVLETGLFQAILENLGTRTTLPIENAYVTIGSGASKEEYEERKRMVLAAGLKSVTILDDAAANALGFFAEELTEQEGEHYVLSVIHDYNGFHSSLLKFDRRESGGISLLKSAPTAKVVNPMDNPAFIMDRMLQDNCQVDGVDYSDRVERVLVDNRQRPLLGSVGQGSFDPYYNEVYGSIFRNANLCEGIEALKGLAYYDSCEKGEKKGVRITLSVFDESAKPEQEKRDISDPNFPNMESTMIGANPFGAGGETFGSSPDPFGAGGETFGSSPDPFGAGGEVFGSSADPFGAGGETFGSSADPFGTGGDMFNATVAGDDFSGQTNGNTAFGKNPFGDEMTADGFGGTSLNGTSSGNSPVDGFGRSQENISAFPGISYSDRGRIYMLNEKKPINDVTMEVNEGGIDLFRKDMKIALAFGMIGSAIEGKGKKFAHIDYSQIRGFGYETPNPKTGQKPALYITDGKVYIFDFANAVNTENILRQIAGSANGLY